AAWNDGHPPFSADPHHGRDVVCGAGQHYDVCRVAALERVCPVDGARGLVGFDVFGAELRREGVDQRLDEIRSDHPATALRLSSDRMKPRSRSVPRFNSWIDVAYEIRKKPGASKASPGVNAMRCWSSSACASSPVVRMP